MNRIIVIFIALYFSGCAPVAVVIDRYENKQEKTVAMVKIKKQDGVKDSLTIELKTFYPTGQLQSSTKIKDNDPHGKYFAYSIDNKIVVKGKNTDGRKQGKWEWLGTDGNPDSVMSFNLGMLSGKKIIYHENGEKKSVEEYDNHKKYGKSIHYNTSGKKTIIAEYINDIPNGKWTWFQENGKKERVVNYSNGIKNGQISIWNEKGKKTITGEYIHDLKNGEWKWYMEEKGLDSLIQYSKNEYAGKYEIWHVNGEKAVIGQYTNNIKTGEWNWYSFKGELDSTKIFANGALNGPVQLFYGSNETKSKMSHVNVNLVGEITNYYLKVKQLFFRSNGELKSSMVYLNDKLHGEKIEYFPDGSFKSLYTYSNGIKNGPFTDWNENGLKKQKGTYKNEKLDGTYFRWFNHGEYSSITMYKDGAIHGVMRYYSPTGIITSEEYYYLNQVKCRFDYHDNGFLKQIQIFEYGNVVFQRNWNMLGLDITEDEFKSGIRAVNEIYPSGNLKTERSYKNDKLHGLSQHFSEDHSLRSLSLYYKGQHVFNRKTDENNEFKDILFPDSLLETIIQIEEDEN